MEDRTHRDIRVFRFKHPLLKSRPGQGLSDIEFRAEGPVPIYNDARKIIGFGTVADQKGFGMVNCAIDPATPERLDLEIDGRRYWLDPVLEFRGYTPSPQGGWLPTLAHVRGLYLTLSPVPGQEPVDPRTAVLA